MKGKLIGILLIALILAIVPQCASAQAGWPNPYYGWPYYYGPSYNFYGMGMSVGGISTGRYVQIPWFQASMGSYMFSPWSQSYMGYYNPYLFGGYPSYFSPMMYSSFGAQSFSNSSYSGMGVGFTYQKTTKNSILSLSFSGGSSYSNSAGSFGSFSGYTPMNPYYR